MYGLIMAGGYGARFWPLSREIMPKQMLRIAGKNTMIQNTVQRIMPLIPLNHLYIATNEKHAKIIDTQLKEINCAENNINFIIEPMGKNTTPAIAVAAIYINEIDPESTMVVMPADHIIQKKTKFLKLLKQAEKLANQGYLVTFGIKPSRPETGYGYIKAGKKIYEGFKVDKFTEKPDLKTAQRYLKSSNYFWNGGIFVWQTKAILQEIKKYLPFLYEKLNILKNSPNRLEALKTFYTEVESISIDYGVMERTDRAAVIPADIKWNDVGSWSALDEVIKKDSKGNIITGNVIDINSQNSIIYGGSNLVASIGLKDIVVVSTDDVILICPKNKSQDVKTMVNKLKERKKEEYL
ncbi:MAG: mannose-1-phosphate guanylyltransferase/mannose-6-phosphate isomerase [bacterium]|nr:mannose-1-phosphate guanylyltransferase/mannose-6-phosphate isomerase [bacterium]